MLPHLRIGGLIGKRHVYKMTPRYDKKHEEGTVKR